MVTAFFGSPPLSCQSKVSSGAPSDRVLSRAKIAPSRIALPYPPRGPERGRFAAILAGLAAVTNCAEFQLHVLASSTAKKPSALILRLRYLNITWLSLQQKLADPVVLVTKGMAISVHPFPRVR